MSIVEESGTTQAKSGLVDSVVEYLLDHVAAQGLRAGSQLPSEESIRTALGVSRPVVREAMRALAGTGLIEMASGKRAKIAPIEGQMISRVIGNAVLIGQVDASDILEVRRGIEVTMVTLAASRRTDADAAALNALLHEMSGLLGQPDRYAQLDMQLHRLLAQATGNPLFPLLIEAFRHLIQASMVEGLERWAATPKLQRVQDLHVEIVKAVAEKDPIRAARAMEQHFDDAINAILGPLVEVADDEVAES
ncbi:FadR/GntR family transcriptional regulator [Sphingomonas hengshuiensis]|uniref:FadR/GntR family transcriptional regulator n=1 Tax=Sphingomonas hengshuiensis TaxID=1609977 RepID=UPI000B181F92|nr:FadR/GntR family transcriptional regulator [Sphingomonas hengshuiensis]